MLPHLHSCLRLVLVFTLLAPLCLSVFLFTLLLLLLFEDAISSVLCTFSLSLDRLLEPVCFLNKVESSSILLALRTLLVFPLCGTFWWNKDSRPHSVVLFSAAESSVQAAFRISTLSLSVSWTFMFLATFKPCSRGLYINMTDASGLGSGAPTFREMALVKKSKLE